MDEKIKALVKITSEQAFEIIDRLEKEERNEDLYLITEWGCAGSQEKAKYVMELGKREEPNWFGDISFLETSKDGVFVRLKT
ncbi:hypothetical protein LCGC14_2064020 [marine sediment metagenome]|uniref:Uncharacterized protein n=1 Tax=marine sediment metagenome TaxID=412755 RepID=A0A0F9F7N9_9ZZZZ